MSNQTAAGDFRCGSVAIIGRPNVGKSTLLNHLIGQKLSITSNKAQTTRHRIVGILTEADAQYLFIDTPGLQRRHENALNRILNRTATQTLEEADVVVFAVEAGRFTDADAAVLRAIPSNTQTVLAVTKADRLSEKSRLLDFLNDTSKRHAFAALVPVSVKHAASLIALKQALRPLLPHQQARYAADELTDRSERFLAAEFIREKLFRQLGEELPYSASVTIEGFAQEGALRRIHATIVVEKSSQKAIVIGEKGERLKRIGTEARREMEETFGGKVFLELWVRVKKGWADDDALVKQYGYGG